MDVNKTFVDQTLLLVYSLNIPPPPRLISSKELISYGLGWLQLHISSSYNSNGMAMKL